MVFEVHRADRSDLLADGLAELLRDPLPDPFARELVIVPARGVERWLSQRLSHRLGPSEGGADGVCAGVDFRSPTSLMAEVLEGHLRETFGHADCGAEVRGKEHRAVHRALDETVSLVRSYLR